MYIFSVINPLYVGQCVQARDSAAHTLTGQSGPNQLKPAAGGSSYMLLAHSTMDAFIYTCICLSLSLSYIYTYSIWPIHSHILAFDITCAISSNEKVF